MSYPRPLVVETLLHYRVKFALSYFLGAITTLLTLGFLVRVIFNGWGSWGRLVFSSFLLAFVIPMLAIPMLPKPGMRYRIVMALRLFLSAVSMLIILGTLIDVAFNGSSLGAH